MSKPLMYLPRSSTSRLDPIISIQHVNLFDHRTNFLAQDNDCSDLLQSLIPPTLMASEHDRKRLLDDMHTNMLMIQQQAAADDEITCRLTLLEGVRCPKWHQDNVKIRLLKTYVGQGTEFVNPNDLSVRFLNYVRGLFDQDLDVNPNKIQRARAGDVLIIRGKVENQGTSVLHRSPPASDGERRLLYTVTVS